MAEASRMSWMTIVGLLGAGQMLVIAAAIATLRNRPRRSRLALAFLLAGFSVAVGSVALEHSGLVADRLYLILLEYTAALVVPPLLWLYARFELDKTQSNLVPLLLNFLPAVLWAVYLLSVTVEIYLFGSALIPRWLPPIMLLVAYMASYTILVGLKVHTATKTGRSGDPSVAILKTWVLVLAVVHTAQIVRYLFREVGALRDIVPLTVSAGVFGLSFVVVRQSPLLSGVKAKPLRPRYEASTLTAQRAEESLRRLTDLLAKEKPYKRPDLDLAWLAAKLSLPRSHLSQLINEHFRTNFSDLLNRYRVEEASRLLTHPESSHLTIEAIGEESGFRSRSAFHETFKKQTGLTPARFRQERESG